MAFGAELIARLGLDTSAFSRGLSRANSDVESFKRILKVGDVGNGFKQLFGAGAIIQGFRATIQHAQEARDRAREMGKEVDAGTASVARYGDAWDKLKKTITDTSVAGLSFFTKIGEKVGSFIADKVAFVVDGADPKSAARTRKISEEAEASADRLSSPEAMAAAKARGEQKKKDAQAADKKHAEELEKIRRDGAEQFERNRMDALSLDEQITEMEKKRAELIEKRGSAKTVREQAQARLDQLKIEGEIQKKKKEQADLAQKESERQKKEAEDIAEREKKYYEDKARRILDLSAKERAAEETVQSAKTSAATARSDTLKVSLGEAAAGVGVSQNSKARARQILRLEQQAQRIAQVGSSPTREADAQAMMSRAEELRKQSAFLKESDRNPFGQVDASIRESEKHLKAIRDSLADEMAKK